MSSLPASNSAEAGLFGVGPKVALRKAEAHPDAPTAQERSAFLAAVRAAADGTGPTGGTFGGPAGRYVAGGCTSTLVLPNDVDGAYAMNAALDYLGLVSGHLFNGFGVGFWLDTNTGRIHLDTVWASDNLAVTLIIGREHGEIAIYDREAGEEIRL